MKPENRHLPPFQVSTHTSFPFLMYSPEKAEQRASQGPNLLLTKVLGNRHLSSLHQPSVIDIWRPSVLGQNGVPVPLSWDVITNQALLHTS